MKKWKIYHQPIGADYKFVDLFEGDSAQEAKEAFKKRVKWSDKTKILTIKEWKS